MSGIVRNSALGAVFAWIGLLGTSAADAGPWSVPSGATTNFSYSNGGDANGLYGDPVVADGTFSFSPTDFQVSASGGGSDSRFDTISFDALAAPGWEFSLVRVQALGSYDVTGSVGNWANVVQTLTVTENVAVGPRVWEGAWVSVPEMPVSGGGSIWQGFDVLSLPTDPPPHESLHFEFSTLLEVATGDGSAQIDLLPILPTAPLTISIAMVPEPNTFILIVLGGGVVLRRRR